MNDNSKSALGIIGVGQLGDFMVRGLRNGGWPGKIVLSPRNAQRVATLARACECSVAVSNQAVVDQADIVMVAVRPEQVPDTMAGIRLRPDQTLLSVAAGLPLARLQGLLPTGQSVIRAFPMSSAEFGASPTMMYPADAAVEALFNHTGQSIVLARESDFDIGTPIACASIWLLDLYGTLADSCQQAGMGAQQARSLVYGMAESAVRVARHNSERSARAVAAEIAWEGSFTRLGLKYLSERDGLSVWQQACEMLTQRLQK